jgi:hypothetical protein
MDQKRGIAGGVLGAAIGAAQFFLVEHYTHVPNNRGLSGLGQAVGRGLAVIAITLACTCIAVAILRLRFWAAVGAAAFFAQVIVLLVLRGITQGTHWHGDISLIIFPISAVLVMATVGLVAPAKPSPDERFHG